VEVNNIVLVYAKPVDSQNKIVPFFCEMRKTWCTKSSKNAGRWIADTLPSPVE